MKISYRWMKEYLNFDVTPAQIVERLVAIGHEVDSITDLGLLENPIRIARIVDVKPHPDADKLTLCTVDDGSGEEATVVCGAPNVRPGMIGVLARTGARLPNGQTLKRAKIRGIRSEGMLMALDEMGLGSDHSGIVELDDDAPVGEGYDLILEVEITPNRPDCLSIFGLARDLAASYGKKVYAAPNRVKEAYESARDMISVSTKCLEDCPRYTARVIKGIRIGPSPGWLQRRLLAVGLRPINNIVDATNLVLMDLGHPIHAFDYDKLADRQIIVRKAQAGETLKIIDQTVVELAAGKDMVIADARQPVALAGVMGGFDSEVTSETTNILIESAYFNPTTIRQTARRHNLSTDASYRFERGADPNALVYALDRVALLIVELAGGEIAKDIIETRTRLVTPETLVLRTDRASRFLGVDISKTTQADLLAGLGFETLRSDGDLLVLTIPSWRVDIEREEDLYEEIGRLYGYNRIVSTLPSLPASAHPLHASVRMRRRLQDQMVALGFSEAINTSFLGQDDLERLDLNDEETLKLLNPMSRDQSILRPDLTPSILRNLAHNQNRGNSDLKLFEVGSTFHFGDMATPCVEKEALIVAMMGARDAASWRDGGAGARTESDFYDLKGVIELLFENLGVKKLKFAKGAPRFLHPGRSARVIAGDVELGWLGELHPARRDDLGLNSRVYLSQIQIELLRPLANFERRFSEIPRFPAMERDLALLADRDVAASQVQTLFSQTAGPLLESLFLFDCYTGERVAEGKKSLGYRAVYRHAERTLQDKEIEEIEKKVLDTLWMKLRVELRP